MAKNPDASFEAAWRDIAPIIERSLARRCVPKWLRDDVMQETALRLYRFWENVDPERSPAGLAMTIANNALADEHRRRAWMEIPGEVPETTGNANVEAAGIARFELGRVRDAMSRLSPSHRSVLLAEVGHASTHARNSAATKMLRLRARKKMRSLLDAASAGGFVLGFRRGLWQVLRGPKRAATSTATPAAVIAACGVVALLGIPDHPGPGVVTERTQPRASVARASDDRNDRVHSRSARRRTPTLRAQPRAGVRMSATTGAEDQEAPGSHWKVGVGDETTPVEGGAVVSVLNDPGGVALPSCSNKPSSEGRIEAECEVDGGNQAVYAKVTVRIGP